MPEQRGHPAQVQEAGRSALQEGKAAIEKEPHPTPRRTNTPANSTTRPAHHRYHPSAISQHQHTLLYSPILQGAFR
jgi:hypothetical protein